MISDMHSFLSELAPEVIGSLPIHFWYIEMMFILGIFEANEKNEAKVQRKEGYSKLLLILNATTFLSL